MTDSSFLDWPFFEPRHRGLAIEQRGFRVSKIPERLLCLAQP